MKQIIGVLEEHKEKLCSLLGSNLINAELVFFCGYHPIVLNFSSATLFLWFYETDAFVLKWEIPDDCQKTPYDYSEPEELDNIQSALNTVKGLTLTGINIIEIHMQNSNNETRWRANGIEFIYGTKKLQIYLSEDETFAQCHSYVLDHERTHKFCV